MASLACMKFVVTVTTVALLMNAAFSANHTVGEPSGGWDIATSLQAWASSRAFHPGDVLTFKYTPLHDVVEVTKADYDSCQVTDPVNSYTDGNTAIPLNAVGKRYFICGVPGHCNLGMKIEMETVAIGDRPHPFALPPASISEAYPPMSAMVVGNPSAGAAGTMGSAAATAPPGASSNSPATIFDPQPNTLMIVILMLLLY